MAKTDAEIAAAVDALQRVIDVGNVLAEDDGEAFSEAVLAIAVRLANGEKGRAIQVDLSSIVRANELSARDMTESCRLLLWTKNRYPDLPISLARELQRRMKQALAAGS